MELVDPIGYLNINEQACPNTEHFAAIIENNETEFILCHSQNSSTYIITQFGKPGNFHIVDIEQVNNGIIDSEPVFNIRLLFGEDNIEVEAGVRYIVQALSPNKTLWVSLTLKDYKVQTLKLIVEALKSYKLCA